jgi:hypothetical protein
MVGRHRNPWAILLWMVLTLGIYGLYWIYISFAEVGGRRGKGVSGLVGLLLALIPVSVFLLPSYIGDMYAEEGKAKPIRPCRLQPVRWSAASSGCQGAGPPQRLLEHGEPTHLPGAAGREASRWDTRAMRHR